MASWIRSGRRSGEGEPPAAGAEPPSAGGQQPAPPPAPGQPPPPPPEAPQAQAPPDPNAIGTLPHDFPGSPTVDPFDPYDPYADPYWYGELTLAERIGRPLLVLLAVLLAAGAGVAAGYLLFANDEQSSSLAGVAPTVVVDEPTGTATKAQLGGPSVATRNTSRIAGADATDVAAGVALASYPPAKGVAGPAMVVLAPSDSWQAALGASSLAADPVGAPILLGTSSEVPDVTQEAIDTLQPQGLKAAQGSQVLAIAGVATPKGLASQQLTGTDAATLADGIDRERARLSGVENPAHILVASSEQPELAMPAAAWAARSGDPIVFADGDDVPQATIAVLERHPDSPVYVLGPTSAISDAALEDLDAAGGSVTRVGAEDPVSNAIEFARFTDGDFGWNINDPGHGFTIANASRPADAGAAAALAAGGKPGPMLLTDSANQVPEALRSFLLDVKPGYIDDPTRAIYNHVWLLGGLNAISLDFQAQIDDLAELVRVQTDTGGNGGGSTTPSPGG